jgi:hypothetical protein
MTSLWSGPAGLRVRDDEFLDLSEGGAFVAHVQGGGPLLEKRVAIQVEGDLRLRAVAPYAADIHGLLRLLPMSVHGERVDIPLVASGLALPLDAEAQKVEPVPHVHDSGLGR